MKQYTLLFSLLLLAGCATSPGIDFPKKFGSYPALQPSKEAPPANQIVTDATVFQSLNSAGDTGNQFVLQEEITPANYDEGIYSDEVDDTFWLKLSDDTYYKVTDTGDIDLFTVSTPARGYALKLPTHQDLRTLSNGDKVIICCGVKNVGRSYAMKLSSSYYGVLLPKAGGSPEFIQSGYLTKKLPTGKAVFEVIGLRTKDGQAVTTAYQPVSNPLVIKINVLYSDKETIKKLKAQNLPIRILYGKNEHTESPEAIEDKIKKIKAAAELEKTTHTISSKLVVDFDAKKVTGTLQGNQDYGPEVQFDQVTLSGNHLTGTVTSDGQTGTLKGGIYGKYGDEIGGIAVFKDHQNLDTSFGGRENPNLKP